MHALTHQFGGFFEDLSRPNHLSAGWDDFRRRVDDLVIQYFLDLGGHRADLILKLLLGVCGCPIYHPREFQEIQSPHSSRLNYRPYLGFQEGRTSLGFLQFEEEASVFGLHTSGGGYHCPDLSLGGVWQHLGVFIFRRAEPLVSIIFSRLY